ncbi:DUF6009 family protein [Streptomyces sp. NPDC090303]|uniref:DUF6009 family protein n=1 Tax=Streptomyces sp. NPDC090303 TaxID=3365960 RepID=UPI00380DCDA0
MAARSGEPTYHRDGRMVGCAVLGADATSSRASGALPSPRLLAPPARSRRGNPTASTPARSRPGRSPPETLQPTVKGRRTERGERGERGSFVPGDAGTRPGSPAPPIALSDRSGGASDRDERFSVPGPACAPRPPRRHTHAPSSHAWQTSSGYGRRSGVPGTRTDPRAFSGTSFAVLGIRDEHPLRLGPDGILHTR